MSAATWTTEIRRGPVRWSVLGLLTVTLVILLGRERDWVGVWPRTSALLASTLVFLTPAAAAATCASVQRIRSRRSQDLLRATPKPSWMREAGTLTTMLTAPVLAICVGAIVVYSMTASAVGIGWPWPSYLLFGLVHALGASALGYVVGTRSRFRLAPLALGAVLFVGQVVWPRQDSLPVWYILSGWPQLQVRPSVLGIRAGLAALFIFLAVRSVTSTRRQTGVRPMVGLASLILVVFAVQVGGQPLGLRKAPGHRACTATSPNVCFWPENSQELPLATRLVGQLKTATAHSVPTPNTLLEEGLVPATVSAEALSVPAVSVRTGPSGLLDSMMTAWLTSSPVCAHPAPQSEDTDAFAEWHAWVTRRLHLPGYAGPGFMLSEAAQSDLNRMLARPEATQVVWSQRLAARAAGCPKP